MTVRCMICDKDGDWENVDKFRLKPQGMCICKGCGFVSYPERISKQKNLKEYYEEDYRKAPGVSHLYSGNRKLHYHNAFLRDLLVKWKEADKPLVIGEVGSAFGMFLNWISTKLPKAEVYGTELTKSYRNVAKHYYDLELNEDLPDKKYDLIASYKVAEHIPDFDEHLVKYKYMVKDDGYLYISVPTWFNKLHNFGVAGFSLEYYWHPDHINGWTVEMFEHLLKRNGFRLVKSDHEFYDDTYLLTTDGEVVNEFESQYERNIELLPKFFQVEEYLNEGKFEQALTLFPNCPEAWKNYYEINRANWDKNGFEWIEENYMKPGLEATDNDGNLLLLMGNICMRYDKFKKAGQYIQKHLESKPNNDSGILTMCQCLMSMAERAPNKEEKVKILKDAASMLKYGIKVCLQSRPDLTNWLFHVMSEIPMEEQC